ncbi:AAA family ATPase [Streptomyces sp. SYSU K21746]
MTKALVIGAGEFKAGRGGEFDPGRSPSHGFRPLKSVAPAVEELARALARLTDVSVSGGGPVLHPDLAGAESAWRCAVAEADGDALVVHLAGHGLPAPGGDDRTSLYIPVHGSERRRLPGTTVRVHQWLEEIEHTPGAPPTLFLIDVCGGGRAALHQLMHKLSGDDRKAWVIAACTPDEKAYGARFTRAAVAVLRRLREGRLDVSPALTHVPVETLAAEIDRELAALVAREARTYDQSVVATPRLEASLTPPPFFVNPAHAHGPADRFRGRVDAALWEFAAEADPMLDPVHFLSRASGTQHPERLAHGCLFTGRRSQRARLTRWLENTDGGEPPLFVLTGSPGIGKSALLGLQVCLAHPQLREVAGAIRTRIPVAERPAENPRLAAVHARGRSGRQVLASLAGQLGLEPDSVPESVPEQWTVEAVLGQLTTWPEPAVLVVDALDEAAKPENLLTDVLLPLAAARRPGSPDESGKDAPLCRVLIGTRPWWDRFAALREAVSAFGQMLDLDAVPQPEVTRDLSGYLDELLWNAPEYGADSAARRGVAESVAAGLLKVGQGGGFLLASLFADYLAQLPEPLTASAAVARLPKDLPGMMELHLSSLAADDPWLRPVLAAVAHAFGDGMPLDLVHRAALALTAAGESEDTAAAPVPEDTRRALTEAAFYLRTTAETDGRQLYRFFHNSLTEYLRGHALRSDASPGAGGEDPVEPARRIAAGLLAGVPGRPGARLWRLALPYLRRHAIDHAALTSVDDLLLDPGFLVQAEPATLTAHLHSAESPQARVHAAIYLSASDRQPRWDQPETRRQLLAVDAVRWGNQPLARALETSAAGAGGPGGARTTTRWATNSAIQPALRTTLALGEPLHEDAVPRTFELGGRPHMLTSGSHGVTHVWDVLAARLRHSLRHGDHSRMLASARLPDGRVLALTADPRADDVVRVWDLADGTPWHALSHRPGEPGIRVRVAETGGRPYALTTHRSDGDVRVWDLTDGTLRATVDHGAPAPSARLITADGRALLLTSDAYSSYVAVWDASDGALLHILDQDRIGPELALTRIGGRPHLLTSGGRQMRLWDLADGSLRHTMGNSGRLKDMGITSHQFTPRLVDLPDGPLAFTAHPNLVVVWDLAEGRPLHGLEHHLGLKAPQVVHIEDRPHALTSGSQTDGRIWTWDLSTGEKRHTLQYGSRVRPVVVAIDGRPHALTVGTRDVDVSVCDLNDGVRRSVLRHDPQYGPWTTVLDLTTIDSRPHAVTSSRGSSLLHVWDLVTAEQRHELRHDGFTSASVTHVDGLPHALTLNASPVGELRLWDLTGRTARPEPIADDWADITLVESDRAPCALVVSDRKGNPAEPDPYSTLQWWDLAEGARRWTLRLGAGAEVAAVHRIDGELCALTTSRHTDETRVELWSLRDGTRLRHFAHDTTGRVDIVTVNVAGDLCALTTGDDGSGIVRLWELRSGALRHTFHHTGLWLDLLATEDPGRPYALTVGDEALVRVWDLTDGQLRHTLPHPGTGRVEAMVAHTPYGPRALTVNHGSDNRTVKVWDPATGALLHSLPHPAQPRMIRTTGGADRHYLLTSARDGAASGALRVWGLADGSHRAALRHSDAGAVRVVPADIDGRPHLLTLSAGEQKEGLVRVWNLADGALRCTLRHGRGRVTALVTEVAGRPCALTSGPAAGGAKLWDLRDGSLTAVLDHAVDQRAGGTVGMATAWIAGRPHLLTHGGTGLVRLWDLTAPGRPVTEVFLPEPVHVVEACASGFLAGFGSDAAFVLWPSSEDD